MKIKFKIALLLLSCLCLNSAWLLAQKSSVLDSILSTKKPIELGEFRANIILGLGYTTGIADASNYQYSHLKHRTSLGYATDAGFSFQLGLPKKLHLELSLFFSSHDFYEKQQFYNPNTLETYFVEGNVWWYGGRSAINIGKEFLIHPQLSYSFSIGPIIDFTTRYFWVDYTKIDHETPANSEFNGYHSNGMDGLTYAGGFLDPVKMSMLNKLYWVGSKRGGGLFLAWQCLYLGKGRFGGQFESPGFYGFSNTIQTGYSFKF